MSVMTDNPYAVLGVSENASPDEVKKAYRKKARENHPDLNPNDPAAAERMNRINEAYDRIMNPEKYAARDRRASAAAGGPGAGYGGGTAPKSMYDAVSGIFPTLVIPISFISCSFSCI